jgi:hypothetical protein
MELHLCLMMIGNEAKIELEKNDEKIA